LTATTVQIKGFGGLSAAGLSLSRGERVLFDELTFELAAGELLLLTGANGSGKSSLLRALLGLAPLRKGGFFVRTDATSVAATTGLPADGARMRALALYQGHAGAVKGELTAIENLQLMCALDGPTADTDRFNAPSDREQARADSAALLAQALTTVGLARQRHIEARRLSQGQRQRLQLARFAYALTRVDRPLWLMDEPSAALDEAGTQLLQALLSQHLARGGSAIAATHLPISVSQGRSRRLELSQRSPHATDASQPAESAS